MRLTDQEKVELLRIARTRIRSRLARSPEPPIPSTNTFDTPCGAFVTLRVDGELRGCVGYVEPRVPLGTAIAEVAEKSAFDDPRFPGLMMEELERVDIEVSTLSPLSPMMSMGEIKVGKHGLVVEGGGRRGLLLPQVAEENKWNAEEFLSHTCIKAGLPPDAWRGKGVHVYLFSAEKFAESDFARGAR